MEQPDESTSGRLNRLDFSLSHNFTDHTPLPSKSYCRLFKVKHYGKWNVLKGLQPQYSADPAYIAMLEKEFRTAVQMDHPNIAHVYDAVEDNVAGMAIVMEYIDGRTLDKFIEEKPSATLRRKVALQLLDAFHYFHSLQIVHRDLKPSNILITRNGDNAKIIDFGLADSDDYAILKEPAYTRAYAAPEQMIDGAPIDCRTDIYAFGLILKQLFPNRYGHIVRRCTQQNPAKRYADAWNVAKAIKQADTLRLTLAIGSAALALAAIAVTIAMFSENKTPDIDIIPTETQLDTAITQPPQGNIIQSPTATAAEPKADQTANPGQRVPVSESATTSDFVESAKQKYQPICQDAMKELRHWVNTHSNLCKDIAYMKKAILLQEMVNNAYTKVFATMAPLTSDDLVKMWAAVIEPARRQTDSDMSAYINSSQLPSDCDNAMLNSAEVKQMQEQSRALGEQYNAISQQAFSGELWQK